MVPTGLALLTLSAGAGGLRVGGSIGYFSLAGSIYRETYGRGNFCAAAFLGYDLSRNLEVRGEVGFFKDAGEMTLTREEINFSMVPVVIGMRVKPVAIQRLCPYLGAGVDFCFFKERARLADTTDSTTGFHVEAGSYFALGRGFHLDINGRFVKAAAKPLGETIELGGWRFGLGASFTF